MYTRRQGSPWSGHRLLLGLLVWSTLLTPGVSQELADPLTHAREQVPEAQRRIAAAVRAAVQGALTQDQATAHTRLGTVLRLEADQALDVYIYTTEPPSTLLEALRSVGVRVHRSDDAARLVYARVPLDRLTAVAALPRVRWIGPPGLAVRRIGSVTSEGDTTMRAALARANLNLTGRGVRVGIISDSLTDLGTSVNSGDLPASLIVVNGQTGNRFEDFNEGQAMAEIIHDLAPGAQLLFHTGFPTSLDFITAVRALTAAGAHVIVDDLGFFNEPVFEDGPVSQALIEAIQRGVVFVSAAGNDAQRHYQGTFQDFAPDAADPNLHVHDFGGGDTRLEVRINAGAVVAIFLQWPNPFDGSANTADYDLILADAAGNTLAISNDNQINTQGPPLEVITFANTTGRAITAGVVVRRVAGPSLPFAIHFNSRGRVTVTNHNVPRSSIFGHPCVREALAVGAIDAKDPDFDTLETFSSQGPCEIFFPQRETRTKPDVTGVDEVVTSLPDFAPFFGTSAAAPHVAAVAALLIEASGGPGILSNTRLANTLRLAAVDRGPAGVDNQFGHGVVDALLAAQAVRATVNTPPRSRIDAPSEDLVVAPNSTVAFQGSCVDVEQNQPFAFAWDFSGVAPRTTVQNPGAITFPTLGVFPVTFTCTDAAGAADPQPARRTITVNNPPDSQITSPGAGATLLAGDRLSFTGTCSDPDGGGPFTFLWSFGSSTSPSTSTQQNPTGIVFSASGTSTVTFACTDVLGTTDPTPARLAVVVNAVNASQGGGGGGGCTLVPAGRLTGPAVLTGLGHVLWPLLVLGGLRGWQRRQGRRSSASGCSRA